MRQTGNPAILAREVCSMRKGLLFLWVSLVLVRPVHAPGSARAGAAAVVAADGRPRSVAAQAPRAHPADDARPRDRHVARRQRGVPRRSVDGVRRAAAAVCRQPRHLRLRRCGRCRPAEAGDHGYAEENLKAFFESPDDPLPADKTLAGLWTQYKPAKIALAFGGRRGVQRSITKDTYDYLAEKMGTEAASHFVPAADLIEEYLDTRIPEEFDTYTALVQLTDVLTRRALSSEVIVPGRTTVGDVRRWLFDALGARGVGTWFQPDLPRPAARDGRADVARLPRGCAGGDRHRARRRPPPRFRHHLYGPEQRLAEDGLRAARGRDRRAGGAEGGDAEHQHAAGCGDAARRAPRTHRRRGIPARHGRNEGGGVSRPRSTRTRLGTRATGSAPASTSVPPSAPRWAPPACARGHTCPSS